MIFASADGGFRCAGTVCWAAASVYAFVLGLADVGLLGLGFVAAGVSFAAICDASARRRIARFAVMRL